MCEKLLRTGRLPRLSRKFASIPVLSGALTASTKTLLIRFLVRAARSLLSLTFLSRRRSRRRQIRNRLQLLRLLQDHSLSHVSQNYCSHATLLPKRQVEDSFCLA